MNNLLFYIINVLNNVLNSCSLLAFFRIPTGQQTSIILMFSSSLAPEVSCAIARAIM